MKISLVSEMRQIDKLAVTNYGIPEILLMENAGKASCDALRGLFDDLDGKIVCILAGSGNNGGDAFVAARHLANYGARVRIFLAGNPAHLTPSAALNRDIDLHMGIEVLPLEEEHDWDKLQVVLKLADAIVDGILGTGFKGELRDCTARLIRMVNAANKPVVAIDLPSGVDADSGTVAAEAVQAKVTVTLGLPKMGHFFCPGADCTGKLLVDPIGMPSSLLRDKSICQFVLDASLAAESLLPRARDVHKGTCGRILIIAGSRGMTGAAALASRAALRSGAGIVTLAVAESLHDIMEAKLTEVMTRPIPEIAPGILGETALHSLLELSAGYDTVLLGPGLGRDASTGSMVRSFAAQVDKPLVLDADAIYAYHEKPELLSQLQQIPVLTPHLGEMAGLLGVTVPELRESLLDITREAAKEYHAVFVLKSERTLVVYPDGRAYVSSGGNSGMATAGCGDVLAGTIAGLMKQAVPSRAPLAGVYLHSLAGDMAADQAAEGLIASDILEYLPKARMALKG